MWQAESSEDVEPNDGPAQGAKLRAEFEERQEVSLFGVRSLWEGIDVPGRSLSFDAELARSVVQTPGAAQHPRGRRAVHCDGALGPRRVGVEAAPGLEPSALRRAPHLNRSAGDEGNYIRGDHCLEPLELFTRTVIP